MRTVLLCLSCLMMLTSAHAGVDVTLKFHYNNYPLCNWEVQLKHNDAPVGAAVTDLNGVATFENVNLFAKEVDAYLYKLPKEDPNKHNAHGFIRLNDDYTGELDFGPIVARKGSPKSELEKAWNITLYECENLTPADLHTVDSAPEQVEKEIEQVSDASIGLQDMMQDNYQYRIDSLNQELEMIDERKQALLDAGVPAGVRKNKIYKAMLHELDMHRQWADVKLRITNTKAHGESTVGMMGEEKALKSRYLAARDERKKLQHQARKAMVEEEDETGNKTVFEQRLNELQTDRALAKQALQNEQDSDSPDAKRIAELKGEIERIQRKIDDLVE